MGGVPSDMLYFWAMNMGCAPNLMEPRYDFLYAT
jgi:hypothetical protein